MYLNFAREESSQSHRVRFKVVKPTPEVIIDVTSGRVCKTHSEMKLFSAWLVISMSRDCLCVQ